MTGRLSGKVALVSGAARGQGRSHAVSLAAEGADIIALDVCGPVQAQGAPPASTEQLTETCRAVEALDRRVESAVVDVRDHASLRDFVTAAVGSLGRLDIVVANAGVNGPGVKVAETDPADWNAVIDTNLNGVFNTVHASLPHILAGQRGGSIILTSSSLALRPAMHFGAYAAAKHGIVGLMRVLAVELGEHMIRVNTVHPTGVATDLLINESTFRLFRPDLEAPALDDVMPSYYGLNVLPIPWVEAVDVSRVVVFLASDEAAHITGFNLPVDGGAAAVG